MSKIKQYFKDYKKSDEVHETSDGFLFHQHHEAVTHAKTLEDKKVTKHERSAQKDEDADKKAEAEKIAADKKAAAEQAKADKAAQVAKEKAEKEAAKKEAAEKAKAEKNKETGTDPE